MGVAGAEHRGLEHAGHAHVGDKLARARREPVAADAVVGLSDHWITFRWALTLTRAVGYCFPREESICASASLASFRR